MAQPQPTLTYRDMVLKVHKYEAFDQYGLGLSVGRLLFWSESGQEGESWGDAYVSAHYLKSQHGIPYPKIIDTICDGIAPAFELADINANGSDELLLFYSSGAHTYNLRIYRILEGTPEGWFYLHPVDPIVCSNMHSIKIVDQRVVVENTEYMDDLDDDRYKLITESYALEGDKLVLKERNVSLEKIKTP